MKLRLAGVVAVAVVSECVPPSVAQAQCSELVQGNAVSGAARYTLHAATARYCNVPCHGEQGLFVNPVAQALIGTSNAPVFTVMSSPSFDGVWKITALDANGLYISHQYVGPVVSHPSIGHPFVGIDSTAIEACLGEIVVLALPYNQPQTSYQWFENGSPIEGANEAELCFEVLAKHSGAIITCVATNPCGSTTAGPFHITTSLGVAPGQVDWRSCRERDIQHYAGQFWHCSLYSAVTLRQGSCQAIRTTLASDGMTVDLEGGIGVGSLDSRTEFRILTDAVLTFTSSRPVFSCSPTFWYTNSGASLSGPIQASLTPDPTGGAGTLELVPGTYTIEAQVSGGNLGCGWQCSGCGPTCYTQCWNCSGWGRLNLSLTITPRPCLGDLNADGAVSGSDLVRLFGEWGTAIAVGADLDRDGIVGNSDLALLLANWGDCP
jgi:hypothetical protein